MINSTENEIDDKQKLKEMEERLNRIETALDVNFYLIQDLTLRVTKILEAICFHTNNNANNPPG